MSVEVNSPPFGNAFCSAHPSEARDFAGADKNANHTAGDFAFDGFGRASDLAVQPRLGLLSEQWTRHRGCDPADFALARTDLRTRRRLRLALASYCPRLGGHGLRSIRCHRNVKRVGGNFRP